MKFLIYIAFTVWMQNVLADTSRHCPDEAPSPGINISIEFMESIAKYDQYLKANFPVLTQELDITSDAESLSELLKQLNLKKDNGNEAFLFIAAEWDVESKVMANSVFMDTPVANVLSEYERINIDVTQHNKDHQEILRHLKMIHLPIYIIYGNDGAIRKRKHGGCLEPSEFISWLKK